MTILGVAHKSKNLMEFMMNKILLFLSTFSVWYMTSDILRENNFNLIGEINAEVDEMPYRHLIKDKD